MLSAISLTFLYFISTALTFWCTDFYITVMGFDKDTSMVCFIVVAVSAPIIGVIYGGIVVQKYFGGYEHKNASYFVIIHLILAASCTLPPYWISNLPAMSINVWCLLALGGSCIPTLQGIVISSLPHKLRASGNSICNLLSIINFIL